MSDVGADLSNARSQVLSGERFAFGNNWTAFLNELDEEQIQEGEESLRDRLGVSSLEGRSFLDIGSGSGLFSLGAVRLGASVSSFDFDPQSVACTKELRSRFGGEAVAWRVMEGSILDEVFTSSLGEFDIVYSWGVLHHTGDMWRAMERTASLVRLGGRLFISIYNDQGLASRNWSVIKRTYNRSSRPAKKIILLATSGYFAIQRFLATLLSRARPPASRAARTRGMSKTHDLVDWVGGWPFEVAKPHEVFDFFHERGFRLDELFTCGGGLGCNEFVFTRLEK
jgi:2-polyprenyl-6-hydroxyphenyl methylase/3-demethylubiquinone-9 3-methyltransferase